MIKHPPTKETVKKPSPQAQMMLGNLSMSLAAQATEAGATKAILKKPAATTTFLNINEETGINSSG